MCRRNKWCWVAPWLPLSSCLSSDLDACPSQLLIFHAAEPPKPQLVWTLPKLRVQKLRLKLESEVEKTYPTKHSHDDVRPIATPRPLPNRSRVPTPPALPAHPLHLSWRTRVAHVRGATSLIAIMST